MPAIESSLIANFVELNRLFQEWNVRYCLIGGLAAGFWGKPRFTQDMDFTVISHDRTFKELALSLKKNGFSYEKKGTSQLKVTKRSANTFRADLILAEINYQDWVVQRAVKVAMFGVDVPICTAEDLIILKLIANRRQDLLDIETVLENPSLKFDTTYLKKWFEFWELEERFDKEFGNLLILK